MTARALASVLIPAYNERHFAAAFASARQADLEREATTHSKTR